jgi:hypothetical protein
MTPLYVKPNKPRHEVLCLGYAISIAPVFNKVNDRFSQKRKAPSAFAKLNWISLTILPRKAHP